MNNLELDFQKSTEYVISIFCTFKAANSETAAFDRCIIDTKYSISKIGIPLVIRMKDYYENPILKKCNIYFELQRAHLAANCDCHDWYGRCKIEGNVWVDDETWSYRCSAKKAEIVGCVATDRANKQEIAANSNQTINGFWFSCQVTDEKVKYEQGDFHNRIYIFKGYIFPAEPHCSVNGTEYHVGNLFRSGVFQQICLVSGIWVTG